MFIGRYEELKALKTLFDKKTFEFGVIHGRRRVGKTTLIKESIKDRKSLYFLAQQTNTATNLEMFSKTYGAYKGVGNIVYNSFLNCLVKYLKKKI